jgi:hypothetical protein
MGKSEMTTTEKLTAREYIEAMRDLRDRLDPETFIRANNYLQAAVRVTGAFGAEVTWATIQSTSEVALRLFELYPDGMPLTFDQLALLQSEGHPVPPLNQIPDWWAGRV